MGSCFSLNNVFAFLLFRNKSSAMDLARKALNIFLNTKHMLGSEHEFALMLLDSKAHWVGLFIFDICSACSSVALNERELFYP